MGCYQVHCEEGEPADDEAADDNPQRFRRLRLHPEPADLIFNVPSAESPVVLGHRRNAACRAGQVSRVVDDAADHGCHAAHAPELVRRARQGQVQ